MPQDDLARNESQANKITANDTDKVTITLESQFPKPPEITKLGSRKFYGKEENEQSMINASTKCITVPLFPYIPYFQGILFSSVQFAGGCWLLMV